LRVRSVSREEVWASAGVLHQARATTCSSTTYKHKGALRGTPGRAFPQPEPNATELPICAPISVPGWVFCYCSSSPVQRELHKDGGGGGGDDARRARAARAPKAGSCSSSCGTSPATPSAAPCAASLTCPSFMCHLRASVAWVSPLADDNGHDKIFTTNAFTLPSFAAPNTSSATSCAKTLTCVLT